MDITVILVVVAAAAALFSFVSYNRMKHALQRASAEEAAKQSLESKLSSLRQEISGLKEDNQRKAKSLEEARENSRKKLRKEAQKSELETSDSDGASDSESDRLKRTLAAMESQIRAMKENSDQAANAIKTTIEAAHQKELSALKDQIEKLEDQLSYAKGENNKRRQNLSKQLATPIDLATLPTEIVGELARLLRKTEQYEKMHGILQGKHQLAQERYQELQRRYFAVCRELALVAHPETENSDEEARNLAESVVEASDSLSMSREKVEEINTSNDEKPTQDAVN